MPRDHQLWLDCLSSVPAAVGGLHYLPQRSVGLQLHHNRAVFYDRAIGPQRVRAAHDIEQLDALLAHWAHSEIRITRY